MDIFYEIFNDLPRGGPGGSEFTRKAYKLMTGLPNEPTILDIGCGKGIQTLELAQISGGHVTGLDKHKPFLDELLRTAQKIELDDKVETRLGNMFSLDSEFEPNSFDVLWSEGAIYIIGFETGLSEWRKLLRPRGYIAVSELCWFKTEPAPPKELVDFWVQEYPAIKTIDQNLEIINNSGYKIIEHFNLPDNIWWESLYDPMLDKLKDMEKKYSNHPKSLEIIKIQYKEVDLFKKYSDWYGYTFFVMQKNE